ncbi:MAG: response regulator transcription factor [Nitrospirae bacterium]|nr:response regulator transcription factor [Nitrospirota bacterium]NTW65959.1 response regulator transcription factor [Nitrospirota bacterium]
MKPIRAIIADDEEALRDHLKTKLLSLWSGLEIAGEADEGETALRLIRELRPDVAFLDISMPGINGIDVAKHAIGRCLFVFVTAHDEFAVEAFEREAVDYLLKPVTGERLAATIGRLKDRLVSAPVPDLSGVLERLSQTLPKAPGHLQWIKAQQKDGIKLIAVNDIYFFRATDKYTTVRTREGEFLIRKTLKELENELDPAQFWRVHRAAIVNARLLQKVDRSIAGTRTIRFKDLPDTLAVSRAYTHLFKQM